MDDPTTDDPTTDEPVPAAVSAAPVRRKSLLRNAGEYACLGVLAIVLASFIRSFLGLAFYIPSESMVPTLKVHDRVVVSRLSYRLHAPRRGDIVVFQNPDYPVTDSPNAVEKVFRNVFEVFGMRQPEDKNLIKRVIGLPGEMVEIKENAVWIDGKRLNEPYLKTFYANGGQVDWEGQPPYTEKIPPNEYWMMGDNRSNSKDSRYFHTIKRSAMVGSAFVRVWPPSRL